MVALTKQNLIVEAEKFRTSKAFEQYMTEWQIDYDLVYKNCQVRLDETVDTEEKAANFCKFCQKLWEVLPDSPSIRTGAFFTLCDFAEYHCYGDQVSPVEEEDGSVEPYVVG